MSDYSVIADLSASLVDLLRDGLQDMVPTETVALLSPADVERQDVRLTLFLYSVSPNPNLRSAEMSVVSPKRHQAPPLWVDLRYLLTAHGSRQTADRTERSLEEQRILGRAMRLLFDAPVLSGSLLKGGLAGSRESFRVVLQALALEDQTRIWATLSGAPMKPSAGYLVGPVAIDSTRSMDRRADA